MRMSIISLLIAVFSVSFFSCFENPTGVNNTGSGYYVKCNVDGVTKRFDQNITVQVMQLTDTSPVAINIIATSGTLTSDTGSIISVFIPGTTPQLYIPGGPITLSKIQDPTVHSTFCMADSLVHSQITLTRCDAPGGIITGTFQGTAYDSINDSMVITQGEFRVSRPIGTGSTGITLFTNDTISVVYNGVTYVWRSKNPDGTPRDLVTCQTTSVDGEKVTQINGTKFPGGFPRIQITLLGEANGSYHLGKKEIDGAFVLALSVIEEAVAIEDTCTDNAEIEHPFSAIVPLSVTKQAGRARGTFSGDVAVFGLVCPPQIKQVTSGAFSIAVTSLVY